MNKKTLLLLSAGLALVVISLVLAAFVGYKHRAVVISTEERMTCFNTAANAAL
jgi:hypothetical protein